MKNHEKLTGMIAATFTPFKENGDVNLAEIEKYAKWIASTPIKGVFVCGTTGEFSSLTVSERKSILEKWIIEANREFKVIAHVGSNCQKASIELAKHALDVEADAISSLAPSFFKPGSVTDLIDYFVPIAQAAPSLPFYYYNMPAMTGVNLPVNEFLKEAKKRIPNLMGTKFTHNNLMEMGQCLNVDDHSFEVLHGYDEILISGLAMGAIAGVGSTYNYIPEIYDGIFRSMQENDLKTARDLQMKSIQVVEVIIKYGGGVRGGKAIMNHIGINCGDCRSPISPFSSKEGELLRKDLDEINFSELYNKIVY
ncbi:N-acetylneuraminate lyase [Dysgonomonas hofstadii]|uniref:N-acetylneuraminate lyase n=1 Tax=Dysgonomonas hofstadii TaxID=637886 RepID=A0A840CY04_9BACT|nr:dihydrodipicolinate synthase family protein [Dysgonomonas hofstadii]MBB4037635.1 N-acetylneuraminate lyase [Dysgonomonas hofstadii]